MIGKKAKENNDKLPNSREMEKLKREFPQFFTKDGDFKLDSFQDFLKEEEIEISKEGYELKFLGKSYAKYLSSLETETFLSPDTENNEKEENKNSENLYIVGDNIDALKHLLGSYGGKIKCIYIDPPYNTGSDSFVYPDNFKFTAENLAEKIGITEGEAGRILNLSGKSTHSAWMTFMYPRLVLARDLLSDDGVIFISIDDNEQANLKLMCDEIFGEENFIETVIVTTSNNGKGDKKGFASNHDYAICYQKTTLGSFMRLRPSEAYLERFDKKDKYGKYKVDGILMKKGADSRRVDSPTLYFPLFYNPETGRVSTVKNEETYMEKYPIKADGTEGRWTWGKEKINNEFYRLYASNKGTIYIKDYLDDSRRMKIKSILNDKGYLNNAATNEVTKTFKTINLFDTPKPTKLIKDLIDVSSYKNSIIVDFFSGSATTADAVMQLNAEDGGDRKYIMVQLPEEIEKNKPAYKAGYRTIDEIGRERIIRAGAKIKEETEADIDYGFKTFYLNTPEEKTLLDLEDFTPEIKLVADDMVSIFDNVHASGKESILATWMMEDGYGLSQLTSEYTLENYKADLIGKTLYIIDEGLEDKDVMSLVKRIENEELDLTRMVVYAPSLTFSVLQELRKNLKVLRNNKNVNLIERF